MTPRDDIPISRALGRFFGHIWQATKPDARAEKRTVSKHTEEAPGEINGRPVTLRRTLIEEIEFKDEPKN